jgi:3-hydroxy-3-methylglutaryl CoA synthase
MRQNYPSARLADIGITGFGVYLPRRRLSREAAFAAQAWLAPSLKSEAKGHRSFACWDEDAITMAVEAARGCLGDRRRGDVNALSFATTNPVFLDRLNAGVIATALNLEETIEAADLIGTRRAGSTGLLQAIDAAAARGAISLVVAAEKRRARAAGAQELSYGDGAAALVIGPGAVLARLKGRFVLTVDFPDRFRAPSARFDYVWEERWTREAGYGRLAPQAIAGALADAGLAPRDIDTLVLPSPFAGLGEKLAKEAGLSAPLVGDLRRSCGDLGAANALVGLAAALEQAKPGERILVVDFAQGCAAYVLEATEAIAAYRTAAPLENELAKGMVETNYLRFLTISGLIDWEKGPKAERDTRTSVSLLHRNRRMIMGFIGARNVKTGEIQFPPSRVACGDEAMDLDALEPYPFAERIGRVLSWSADHAALTPDPPNYYGMIVFEGGGRLMMDFADIGAREAQTDARMRMVFRIKDIDGPRDYTRYFWKATPARA